MQRNKNIPNNGVNQITKEAKQLSLSNNEATEDLSTTIKKSIVSYSDSAGTRLGMSCAKRPDRGGTKGRPTEYNVNFFPIDIDYSTTAYQYNLELECFFTRKDGTQGFYVVKKEQKLEIVKKCMEKHEINPFIYDGDRILFLSKLLPDAILEVSLLNENNEAENYKVNIKNTSQVDLYSMREYIENRTNELPLTGINLLDVLFRQNRMSSHVLEKRSMFNINDRGEKLSDGLIYYQGQYQSVKACEMGWLQNVDLESCVFYEPINLVDYLKEIMRNVDLNREMIDSNLRNFEKSVKGIMIHATHLEKPKKYRVNKLVKSASSYEFELKTDENNVRKISVATYFQETYKKLKYPNMPCVCVGDPKRPICFPIESCQIAKGQRYMKKLNPFQQAKIARVNDNKYDFNLLSKFGVVESGNPKTLTRVRARVLDPPSVYYNDKKPLQVRNGQWKMMNKRFVSTTRLSKWICVWMSVDSRRSEEENKFIREKFLTGAKAFFTKYGLVFDRPPVVQVLNKHSVEEIFDLINKNCPNPQLVILIINDEDDNYAKIKIAEKNMGITTQCLKFEKLVSQIDLKLSMDKTQDDYKLDMYLGNVALKINAKIGGQNNYVDFRNIEGLNLSNTNDPVMFMGADVTNFGLGSERNSIASVVASRDLHFVNYCVRLSEQKNSNENRKSQEIILDLEEMSALLIRSFQKNNKMLPKRIIFYRDGVDSGQFQEVLDKEIKALRNACTTLNFQPKITMIIVQKRHHTKFFPINDQDKRSKHGNIPSGSVVDTSIVNKNLFEFYLCSHEAIQGTAKSTRYVVIHDENNFSSDDIQYLTFDLCHLYVKSTKSVSIPAPVYYAHLAAYRGRLYEKLDEENEENGEEAESAASEKEEIRSKLIELHPNLEEKMFFA